MKTICIFVIFSLSVIVEGAWWAAAVQPIVLSLGAAFTAMNLDVQPFLNVDLKSMIFKKDKEEPSKANDKEEETEEEKNRNHARESAEKFQKYMERFNKNFNDDNVFNEKRKIEKIIKERK